MISNNKKKRPKNMDEIIENINYSFMEILLDECKKQDIDVENIFFTFGNEKKVFGMEIENKIIEFDSSDPIKLNFTIKCDVSEMSDRTKEDFFTENELEEIKTLALKIKYYLSNFKDEIKICWYIPKNIPTTYVNNNLNDPSKSLNVQLTCGTIFENHVSFMAFQIEGFPVKLSNQSKEE